MIIFEANYKKEAISEFLWIDFLFFLFVDNMDFVGIFPHFLFCIYYTTYYIQLQYCYDVPSFLSQ